MDFDMDNSNHGTWDSGVNSDLRPHNCPWWCNTQSDLCVAVRNPEFRNTCYWEKRLPFTKMSDQLPAPARGAPLILPPHSQVSKLFRGTISMTTETGSGHRQHLPHRCYGGSQRARSHFSSQVLSSWCWVEPTDRLRKTRSHNRWKVSKRTVRWGPSSDSGSVVRHHHSLSPAARSRGYKKSGKT